MNTHFTLNSQMCNTPAMGFQTDGPGAMHLAVANAPEGQIPGKAQNGTCWYPYGGKENYTTNFVYICFNPGAMSLVPHAGHRPPNAVPVGHQNDQGPMYAAVAKTPHGYIPGKVNAQGLCHYPWGDKEHIATSFSWVVPN